MPNSPLPDILDQADLIYRYHWAVISARLKGADSPSKLEAGVVQDRHYVLNWIIGYYPPTPEARLAMTFGVKEFPLWSTISCTLANAIQFLDYGD